MPRFALVSLTALAFVLAGCDRQSEEAAQPEAAADAGSELTGTIDRSFAGQMLPAVELTDPAGAKLATADLKGTPVLLNLWATWCVPCVTEMPMLDELAGELGDSVKVVTVSQDMNAEVVGPFFAERKFAHLPQWIDPKNALAVAYSDGGAGLPLTVLVDAEGKEVWRVAGGYDWSTAEAREAIAEASKT